ncbi:hypothetical protein C8J57DRAFT_1467854, partial [Mycena rebaudengoi]
MSLSSMPLTSQNAAAVLFSDTPARRLPVELWHLPFVFYLGNIPRFYWTFERVRRRLMHICHYWHAVVTGNPIYWTHVYVDGSVAPQCILYALSLSGRAGVSVLIHLPSMLLQSIPGHVFGAPFCTRRVLRALGVYSDKIHTMRIVAFNADIMCCIKHFLHCSSFGSVPVEGYIARNSLLGFTSLHLRHIKFVWPHNIVLPHLHTLVLHDLDGKF